MGDYMDLGILAKSGITTDRRIEKSKSIDAEIVVKPNGITNVLIGEVKEGNKEYHPKINGIGQVDCDCSSFYYSNMICRHIIALLTELDEEEMLSTIKRMISLWRMKQKS